MTLDRLGMTCPACHIELKIADRQGVEVDYCPQCRGVWLERGELDKIIERSAMTNRARPERYEDDDYDDERYRRDPQYRRKRRGLLGELFDFD